MTKPDKIVITKPLFGKKVLMLGGSYNAMAYLQTLKQYGLHITLLGRDRDEPGHHIADVSIYEDYSNPAVVEQICGNQKFDFLVPGCNDYSYLSAAESAARHGFVGYDDFDTVKILHTKDLYRDFLLEHDLPSPRYFSFEDLQKNGLETPVLVKPTDSFSGRGISHIEVIDELEQAIDHAIQFSRRNDYTIEEYVSGGLHSHSAFIKHGSVEIDFFVDEYCDAYKYQVDGSCHPSAIPQNIKSEVRAAIEKKVDILGLCDGLIHTQFIAQDERFWLIECMRRAPGDLYGRLIEHSTGFPYNRENLHQYLGIGIVKNAIPLSSKPILRHTISSTETMMPIGFTTHFETCWQEVIPLHSSGQPLEPAPFGKQAIIFMQLPNNEELWRLTPQIKTKVSPVKAQRA